MGTPELDSYLKQVGTFAALQAVSANVSKVETDDAETFRRVREWAEDVLRWTAPFDDHVKGVRSSAREVLSILNGTERKETKR